MSLMTSHQVLDAWARFAGEPELGAALARRFYWNSPDRFIVNLGTDTFLGPVHYDVAPGTLEKILDALDERALGAKRVFAEFGAWGTVVFMGAKGVRVNSELLLACLLCVREFAPQEEAALAAHALGGVDAVLGLVSGYLGQAQGKLNQ